MWFRLSRYLLIAGSQVVNLVSLVSRRCLFQAKLIVGASNGVFGGDFHVLLTG